MKRRLIATGILALAVCGGIAILMLTQPTEEPQKKTTDGVQQDPAAGFVPRRTRAELEMGIAEARAEREKLAATGSPGATDAEAAQALEMQKKLQAAQTPSGAEAEARARLAEIEQKLSSTSDPKEREQLERQKRLVEEVIAKLGKL
jgi:hypothetical protein